MTIATPTETLEQRLADRARAFLDSAPTERKELEEGLWHLANAILGDWYVYEESADSLDEHRIGDPWLAPLAEKIRELAMRAVAEEMIPGLAKYTAISVRLSPPPAHLVAHEGSAQLRDDLRLDDEVAERLGLERL